MAPLIDVTAVRKKLCDTDSKVPTETLFTITVIVKGGPDEHGGPK
jgi:hypothetical protein